MIVVGKPGEKVLVLELARILLAAGELESESAELPDRESGKSRQAERDRVCDRQKFVHHGGGSPFRLPAEPADDPTLGIEHGLNVPPFAGWLVLKAELFESRGAFEHANEFGLDLCKIGRKRLACPHRP